MLHLVKSRRVVARIGLLGLGTVGSGVAEILSRHGDLIAARTGVELKLVRALVRRPKRARAGAARHIDLTTKPEAILTADDVDIVVELIGGKEPARSYILAALAAHKPVVTANKAVLAAHGVELFERAARSGADVYFEGAVAGGVPIIRTLREGLASDRISAVTGILNGTTNFILDQMRGGAAYGDALARAQQLGFAEADPSLDVGGQDAADKLSILIQLAFGSVIAPRKIPIDGITNLTPEVLADAERMGYRVKLLGIARRAGEALDARVHPALLPSTHVLANVPAAQNAIAVQSDALGTTLYQGAGAGGLPTGSAVVADLIEVARNLRAGISGRVHVAPRRGPKLLDASDSASAYYLRLSVLDRPGVLASITRLLAERRISMASVLQRDQAGAGKAVPVVVTTHPARVGAMQAALAAMRRLPALRSAPNVVRIEAEL
jgi:homoserine dehydrogenase